MTLFRQTPPPFVRSPHVQPGHCRRTPLPNLSHYEIDPLLSGYSFPTDGSLYRHHM